MYSNERSSGAIACGFNPNVPKTFLMDCAKLKTEQAIRTKLTKYLAKLDKTAIHPARASKTAALMNRLESLQGELANFARQDLADGKSKS